MINKNFPNYSKSAPQVRVISGGESGPNRAERRREDAWDRGAKMRNKKKNIENAHEKNKLEKWKRIYNHNDALAKRKEQRKKDRRYGLIYN